MPVIEPKKYCRECIKEKPLSAFSRLGKSPVCRDCKFTNPEVEVTRRRRKRRESTNLEDHASIAKGFGGIEDFF